MTPESAPSFRPMLSELRIFLRDFIRFAGRKGAVAAGFVALGAMLEGIGLLLVIPLLDIVIGSGVAAAKPGAKAAFGALGVERPFAQLALLLGVFAALMLARAAVISVRDVRVAELRVGFIDAQRMGIARCLAAAPWDKVATLHHARVTNVMGADVQRIGAAAHFVLQCTVAGAMLLVQCILVLVLAPAFALIAFVALAIGTVAFIPVLRRARRLGGFQTGANQAMMTTTGQFLGGLKLAVSQNLQASFVAEFGDTVREQARRQIEFVRQQTNTRLTLATVSALAGGLLVLIGFGAFEIAPPTLIALLLIITRMSGPFGQIQLGAQQLAHSLSAYENLKALERDLGAIRQDLRAIADAPPLPEGPVVFNNVSFVHAGGNGGAVRGVRAVSVTIAPGEFIGITGPSGAGKTTFADLLVGLFPPQQGSISVAGVPLEGAALASWRRQIGYISQDPFLFHDTVRRNLAWANPQATEAQMWDALALAGAGDLVRRMERGIDTVVGERGTLVSGGERQRIALARAVLRAPRLLVLDEATSAIDVAGEREILSRLRALAPRPTIAIVAHRAESLALCDRVLRFDDGRCR